MTVGYENNKRWRKEHPHRWLAGKRRYYRQFQENAHNKNQEWSIEDINIILERKISDRNISFLIGRSVGSIQCKRVRLKNEIKRKEEVDERRKEGIRREVRLVGSSDGIFGRSGEGI